MTPRQQRFVDEYLIDLNATQAAIRTGYSKRTARQIGANNLRKPEIRAAVREAIDSRQQRTRITQDRVLQELARIAFFDIRTLYREDGTLKNPTELDDDAAAVLAGVDVVETVSREPKIVKKARTFDKGAALALAMRHLGMFKDKIEATGKDGAPLAQPAMPVINLKLGN